MKLIKKFKNFNVKLKKEKDLTSLGIVTYYLGIINTKGETNRIRILHPLGLIIMVLILSTTILKSGVSCIIEIKKEFKERFTWW